MAATILELKQRIGSLKLIPAGGGAFEVRLDGQLLYSKLQTGEYPEPSAILREIQARL